jgi:hypothetical protein
MAITKIKMPITKVIKLNYINQPSVEKVQIDEKRVIKTAEIRPKYTVYTPWFNSALKPVVDMTIPPAKMRTWAMMI